MAQELQRASLSDELYVVLFDNGELAVEYVTSDAVGQEEVARFLLSQPEVQALQRFLEREDVSNVFSAAGE